MLKKTLNFFLRKSNLSLAVKIAIALVKGYQWTISLLLPSSCRFYPTCSNYSIEAFRTHGLVKGLFMSGWRILRCNPFNKGGYDPVVPAKSSLERKT